MNDSLFLFFTELLLSSFDDILARLLLGSASLVTLSRDTFARTRMSASLATLTAAHRVVNGVHDNAAVTRTAAKMTAAAGFTTNLEVVLGIADDTDSGAACLEDHAHLTAGHFNDSILVVAGHELGISTSGTHHLGTLAGAELNVVNECTERYLREQQGVANLRGHTGTRHDSLTNLQALWAEDIALLTVGIADEGDTRAAVGVILDGLHNCGDTVFVAFEVHKTVQFLVTTTDITHGHLTLVVAATAFADAIDKALLRSCCGDIIVGNNEFVTLAGSCGFNFL